MSWDDEAGDIPAGAGSGGVDPWAQERAERVLRAVLAERATAVTPPVDLEHRVHHRNRVRVRLLVAAAAAAAVLVGAGIPVGLTLVRADAPPAGPTPSPTAAPPPEPTPSPTDSCVPQPRPQPAASVVPASRLPRQTGVRGSLAGDRELVDAVLVAGWQGLRASRAELNQLSGEHRTMDVRTLRLRFVERAGPGVLALVTAADTTGQWQAAQWVVRENGRVLPAGGPSGIVNSEDFERRQGSLFSGDDPLFISWAQVCGGTYGVVLAPPDTTARLFTRPRIDADTPPLRRRAAGSLPLVRGLAVFPADTSAEPSVGVLRAGSIIGEGSLGGG